MDSENRDLCHDSVLRTSRHRSLWKRDRRLARAIRAFCGPLGRAAVTYVERDLIFQHAEISAIARLFAHDTRTGSHPAWIARRYQDSRRDQSHSASVWPGADVLLPPAHLP